jgi:hypothetical protein
MPSGGRADLAYAVIVGSMLSSLHATSHGMREAGHHRKMTTGLCSDGAVGFMSASFK